MTWFYNTAYAWLGAYFWKVGRSTTSMVLIYIVVPILMKIVFIYLVISDRVMEMGYVVYIAYPDKLSILIGF